ncbi:hypothetical protein PHYPSEUDO_005444 [Phytophthora pseudosyringae]|uniref:C2H2-type domain-containing protein n=1 Tax=Phytophthora pseudosyringae TaxID=221518 RepID=A0A8T1VKX7_9STRA|nr:hypothetical protein PHYPSEUDO_005444 [Phytophthora pseudosyringae]
MTEKVVVAAVSNDEDSPAIADPSTEASAPPSLHMRARPDKVNADGKTCPKCGKVMQSRLALRLHLNRVYPCDARNGERLDGKSMWDRYGTKTCNKCGKTFTTTGGLRLHTARLTPCDAPELPHKDNRVFKCDKCQGIFASAQSLQKHQSRVFPCDDSTRKQSRWGRKTCHKCHKTFCSGQSLRFHLNRVTPCDAVKAATSQANGGHTHRTEAAEGKPQAFPDMEKLHSCPRCWKTFATQHGLHIHMGKKTACLLISQFSKPPSAEQGYETMPNVAQCSEEQHRSVQVKKIIRERLDRSSGADPESVSSEATSAADSSCSSPTTKEKGAENDTSNLSSRGSKGQPGDGSDDGPFAQQVGRESWRQAYHKNVREFGALASLPNSRKRVAEYDSKELSLVEKTRKRTCNEIGPFADLVPRLSKTIPMTTILPQEMVNSSTRALCTSSGDSVAGNGGDILTGGCCCRACVRRWAHVMITRLEHLSDEVTNLRGGIKSGRGFDKSTSPNSVTSLSNVKSQCTSADSTGVNAPRKADTIITLKNANHDQGYSCTSPASNREDEQIPPQSNPARRSSAPPTKVRATFFATTRSEQEKSRNLGLPSSTVSAEDLAKKLLLEKYNHLNEQIITNERALEDSVVYLKKTSDHDMSSSLVLRSQIDELRVYINVAKGKRDESVAAVVAHRWNAKSIEFRLLLEKMTMKSKPDAEKIFHEECAEIATQLCEKDKILSELGTGMPSKKAGSILENEGRAPKCKYRGELSKFDIELAAKNLLEHERDEIFMRLLRSSRRIYLLTKDLLLLKT